MIEKKRMKKEKIEVEMAMVGGWVAVVSTIYLKTTVDTVSVTFSKDLS